MKKLFIIFLTFFCTILISCSNVSNTDSSTTEESNSSTSSGSSDNSNIQGYQNNSVDSEFNYYEITGGFYVTVESKSWLNGYKRTSGTSGIVGTWHNEIPSYNKTITFNSNGTYTGTYTESNGTITYYNGIYELSKNGNVCYIRIIWNSTEYNLQYMVSNNYFCHQDSGCPI